MSLVVLVVMLVVNPATKYQSRIGLPASEAGVPSYRRGKSPQYQPAHPKQGSFCNNASWP